MNTFIFLFQLSIRNSPLCFGAGGRDFDMDVDAIQHGIRDAYLVARYSLERTGAFTFRISIITAGAGIHTSGMFFDGYCPNHQHGWDNSRYAFTLSGKLAMTNESSNHVDGSLRIT